MYTQIGEKMLLSFKLDSDWNKKQLYNQLIDEIGANVNPADQRKYGRFFLKIKGKYDHDIIQNEPECLACPYNSNFASYHDYNILKDEKEPVLVLASKYINFKEYEIYAAYFTDKDEIVTSNNIELWAMNTGIGYYILKFLGLRR